ncbi:hypothetical protein DIE16_21090 [Burkholderia sp. Bp9090]|nr:hypothetical protein DIE16_21090 [Burkholderia sp. Bp9090]
MLPTACHRLPLTAHCPLLTAHRSPLTAHRQPPTAALRRRPHPTPRHRPQNPVHCEPCPAS